MDVSEWIKALSQNWLAQLIAWLVIVGSSAKSEIGVIGDWGQA